jgi:RNA polymerase sigma-70 factor (ECF subfamily)
MSAALSDGELATRCRNGDLTAFDELVQRYQRRIVHLAYRMTGNADTAEDLAQEVFVRVYTRLHLYDPQRPFAPWLFQVATNVCLNEFKVRHVPTISLDESPDEDSAAPLEIADWTNNPEQLAEKKEFQQLVQKALLSLPPHYRAVMVLRHLEGMEYEEIAQATGLPLGTVKTNIFRAKEILRNKLKPVWQTYFGDA